MQFWVDIALILVLSAHGLTYEIAAGRVFALFFGTTLFTGAYPTQDHHADEGRH